MNARPTLNVDQVHLSSNRPVAGHIIRNYRSQWITSLDDLLPRGILAPLLFILPSFRNCRVPRASTRSICSKPNEKLGPTDTPQTLSCGYEGNQPANMVGPEGRDRDVTRSINVTRDVTRRVIQRCFVRVASNQPRSMLFPSLV